MPASRAARVLKKLSTAPPPTSADGSPLPLIFARPASSNADGLPSDRTARVLQAEEQRDAANRQVGEFVRPLRGERNTAQDLTSLLETACGVGDWETAAMAFAHAMRSSRDFVPTQRQTSVLVRCAVEQGVAAALEGPLLESLAGHRPLGEDQEGSAVNNGSGEQEYAGPAAAAGSPSAPTAARHHAASELISAYVQSDQWEPALRVFAVAASTASPRAPLPAYLCNAAAQACERGERWEDAIVLLNAMNAANPSAPASVERTPRASAPGAVYERPNAATYAAVMAALEHAGRSSELKTLTAAMPGREADDIVASYAALVDTWSARHAARSMKRF